MSYYWELETFDGTKIAIPPASVEVVKRRWDAKEPIHISTGSLPANQIKSFRITERKFNDQNLLEAAARAFNEPQITDSGIKARWVKRHVSQQAYQKVYAQSPGYHSLGELNGMVSVAYRLPTHQIDPAIVDYCSEGDIAQLTNKS